MERLSFTNSFEVNRQLIRELLHSVPGITHTFTTSKGPRELKWDFAYVHDMSPSEYSYSACYLSPSAISIKRVPPQTCICKFTLKRDGFPDEECKTVGEAESDYKSPTFFVPKHNPIFQFFLKFVENPNETNAVLIMDMELPKKCFAVKKEEPYKILTVKDKHDLHIVCTDGVFYTRKCDLVQNSDYFRAKFQNEWKDRAEVKLERSLETLKVFVTYALTKKFVEPQKMNFLIFKETVKMASEFGFENNDEFLRIIIIWANRKLENAFPCFYDLVSCLKLAHSLGYSRIMDMIEPMLDKNYYSEISTHYKPEAKFTDNERKEIHKMLHEEDPKAVFDWEKSIFERIIWRHKMNQKRANASKK